MQRVSAEVYEQLKREAKVLEMEVPSVEYADLSLKVPKRLS